jgi:transposase-like protein
MSATFAMQLRARWRLCRYRYNRHKERNVLAHLPEAERPLIQRKLRAAWANPDADAARRELEALARALGKKRPGAAASLRAGDLAVAGVVHGRAES